MKIKEPVSALTHFAGAVLSTLAVFYLLFEAYEKGDLIYLVAYGVFGFSLVALYTASTIYHMIDRPEPKRRMYKRIDHMMIFVLIAGSYTPICLLPLHGLIGYSLLGIIWLIAIGGILMKALWIDAPRWLSTGMYLLMGWLVILAIFPIFKALPSSGFFWLVAGGITYTMGGIIYGLKWPLKNAKWFGFHEIFHIFVMLGSTCHFILVAGYI